MGVAKGGCTTHSAILDTALFFQVLVTAYSPHTFSRPQLLSPAGLITHNYPPLPAIFDDMGAAILCEDCCLFLEGLVGGPLRLLPTMKDHGMADKVFVDSNPQRQKKTILNQEKPAKLQAHVCLGGRGTAQRKLFPEQQLLLQQQSTAILL
ncbi:hypothetical protein QTO34_013752 [Cnephaeus nilssonii]|uniref:Uncharacterized protein n=1 Tax=Cnephaeus nilssonii TaxID=3371016 RepID=A0AA40LVA4_CNENI|nr:hypothetical protein QTO34_013752 [Eptesicus nilssonii]